MAHTIALISDAVLHMLAALAVVAVLLCPLVLLVMVCDRMVDLIMIIYTFLRNSYKPPTQMDRRNMHKPPTQNIARAAGPSKAKGRNAMLLTRTWTHPLTVSLENSDSYSKLTTIKYTLGMTTTCKSLRRRSTQGTHLWAFLASYA
jgi:hypothetical protein